MGFWDTKPFDNDQGLDIKAIWKDYIQSSIDSWGAEKISNFFKSVYFKGTWPVISDGNSNVVIAIAELFHENSLEISNELKEFLSEAISWELHPDNLSEWGKSKKRREKTLREIADRYGFQLEQSKQKPKKSKYADEINSLKKWFSHLEEINGVRETKSLKTIEFIESIRPAYGKMLDETTWDFYDESDEDGSAEVGNLRFMYVVWFALFNIEYDSETIIAAVKNEEL